MGVGHGMEDSVGSKPSQGCVFTEVYSGAPAAPPGGKGQHGLREWDQISRTSDSRVS